MTVQLMQINAAAGDIPNWFAVIMGIGTVFVSLLSIIVICVITGALCGASKRDPNKAIGKPQPAKVDTDKKRDEILAAVCAACAEEMGADVSTLKVISFRKL